MRTIFLLCSPLLLLTAFLFAQSAPSPSPYTIQHYTDEDGLPQNSVKCLIPDEHGFMWMATENGLVRFDGKQFLAFNGSNLPIHNSRIHYVFPNINAKGIFARTIDREVLVIRNGKAALSASRDFDYISYTDTSAAYPVTGLPDIFLARQMDDIYLIPVGPDSYFKVDRHVISFLAGGKERYRIRNPGVIRGNLFILDEQLCYMDKNGQFIMLTKDGARILTLEGELLEQRRFSTSGQEDEIYWNFAARQLFIYTNRSCYRLSLVNSTTISSRLVLKDVDFQANAIVSVYHDDVQQRVFLGSRTKGLYVCKWKQFRNFKAGEGEEVYYAQAPFGENKIVTPGGAVFGPDGTVAWLPLLSSGDTLDRYSIARDMNGYYWYKSYWTLIRFNQDLSAILWAQKLKDGITQLYEDSTGRLWVGTRKNGLYFLQTTAAHPEPQHYPSNLKSVSYLMSEGRDMLWVGSESGLYRIHLPSGKVDTIPGFDNRYVRSIYVPRTGEVWITTYNYGVSLYKDGRLTNLPMDPKKYMASAHCIVADNQGFLWITTNKGLFQVSNSDVMAYVKRERNELFYLYYGKDQGFSTNEFNGGCQPCALKLQNGDISMPSLDGLVYFTPVKIKPELPDRQIFIDEAELDDKMMEVDSTLSLPDKFHHLRLYVSTPYYGDHNNLRLYYSLEEVGGDERTPWIKVNDNRIIEFSSMHSGTYRLRIRKINGFGENNITEKNFVIHVQEGFYETIWFRLLAGVVFLLVAYAFSWLWVRRVKRKNRILEQHVQERTGELKETLSNLQLSEQQLRRQGFIQQRLTAAMSHDLKTPLRYVMQVIRKEDKSGLSNDERNVIYDAVYGMFHLVENLISYMRSQFMSDDSSLEITDLYYVLEEKANIFRAISTAKEVTVINETPQGTLVLVNRQLLGIVIHNLLDNAVKYTRKGHVKLKAACNEETISIRLTDTGIGMPAVVMDWINQYRNNISVTEGKPPSYDGIGLVMVMELLQLINGSITVERDAGGGTVIDITLAVIR